MSAIVETQWVTGTKIEERWRTRCSVKVHLQNGANACFRMKFEGGKTLAYSEVRWLPVSGKWSNQRSTHDGSAPGCGYDIGDLTGAPDVTRDGTRGKVPMAKKKQEEREEGYWVLEVD